MREHLHPEVQAAKYIVFVNDARRYTDCSPHVSNLVGYDRTEILNMKIDELSFENCSVLPLFEKYQRERQQDGEYILRHKDGTPVLIRYKAWIFDDGCHAASWEPAEEWEQLYLAALLETHASMLQGKVNVALSAIQSRRSGPGESPGVSQKLRDAYEALRSLVAP